MEFSFGDEYKDGPLALGMHKRGSFYDIVTVDGCCIVDEDYRKILRCVRDYFSENAVPFYHKQTHQGYLRHLLVRKGVKTGDILIDLVTTSQLDLSDVDWVSRVLALELSGTVVGVPHLQRAAWLMRSKTKEPRLSMAVTIFTRSCWA